MQLHKASRDVGEVGETVPLGEGEEENGGRMQSREQHSSSLLGLL